MTGIYKITNKSNGKSYIGQSVHCGKRLDEHCKGEQFIDEVIQLEGIENFTFEVLRECNKAELSFWEDYYIMQYDTMFPKGYNKKWNCSDDIRDCIKITLQEEKRLINEINEIKENKKEENKDNSNNNKNQNQQKKATSKTSIIFTWLYAHNNNYFIYKGFNVTEVCNNLNISRATWHNVIRLLKELEWIEEDEYKYTILKRNDMISPNLAYTFIPEAINLNYYLFLFYWQLHEGMFIYHSIAKNVSFSLSKLIYSFYKSSSQVREYYPIFIKMMEYFQNYGLLKFKIVKGIKKDEMDRIIITEMLCDTNQISHERFLEME